MPEFTNNNNLILGGLAACAVGVLGISYIYLRREKREYTQVGVVSKLFIHPIKSCGGLEVSQAECVALGIKSNGVMDRSFLVIDANKDSVSRIRQPSLALVAPSLSADMQSLLINAPGMPTLTVPLHGDQNGRIYNSRVLGLGVQGEDCGETASEWFSQYLGKPRYRLVCYSNKCNDKILQNDRKWGSKSKAGEKGMFQNLAHLHLFSESSLINLNSKLEKQLHYDNFRPNIVVDGCTAFSEDKWKYVRIGDEVNLRTTHKCARCPQTTVDPEIGKFMETKEPLKTLRTYRMATPDDPDQKTYGANPVFGTNLAIESFGVVKLGDPVYASLV
ncbi:mitochondrial amidoxime reducing component 2-like [Lytechinus variegatus]|uniref:mitochondrial amidoxime reducing component 2-like n=1 Tax=Lytechinus variegatus TaxID=7654 RepID=UPI001BB13813|nr:mitochondrial amidoxime reducing component 2-like [Lytechinus variegatus]